MRKKAKNLFIGKKLIAKCYPVSQNGYGEGMRGVKPETEKFKAEKSRGVKPKADMRDAKTNKRKRQRRTDAEEAKSQKRISAGQARRWRHKARGAKKAYLPQKMPAACAAGGI